MIPTAFQIWLQDRFGGQVRWNEPMSAHTSLRVGGPAEAYIAAADAEGLRELVSQCVAEQVPYFILAGGTNLLVRDSGLAGVVIDVKKGFKEIRRLPARDEVMPVAAGAGVNLQALCRFAIEQGLAGMNFALGIPGTVGGAIAMNAGTARGDMAGVVASIRLLTPKGRFVEREKDGIGFDYRGMSIPGMTDDRRGQAVIVDAVLELTAADPETVRAEADALLQERLLMQPTSAWSAGCFFKNPSGGESAGRLIDQAGLKGQTVGGAAVSERHANFIINTGQARAADILALMELVQMKVADTFDVMLEPEVHIVGE